MKIIREVIKYILIVLGVCLSVYLLVFVHYEEADAGDRKVITLWRVTGADESVPQIPLWFNDSQDEIFARSVGVPFLEIERKFLTGVIGNVPPDVFEYFGAVGQWAARGALLPLNDYIERDGFDKSTVFPALWDEVTWSGKIYAIPTGTACDAFYWNKQHFREAGLDPERPPKTWAELEEYAKKLTLRDDKGKIERAGYIPGYWSASPLPLFIFWAMQLDAEFLSEDGTKVNVTSDACIKALELDGRIYEALGRDDLLELSASFGHGTQQGFLSENLSMVLQKSSFIQEIDKYNPDIDYGVAMFPVPEGGHPAATSGSVWVGIPVNAKNPDEAWEYIKYMCQTEVQMKSMRHNIEQDEVTFLPANMEVANSPEHIALPGTKTFLETLKWANSPTIIPWAHGVFYREYTNAWNEVIRGKKSAKEALTKAEAEIQRELNVQLEYDVYYRDYLKKQDEELKQ